MTSVAVVAAQTRLGVRRASRRQGIDTNQEEALDRRSSLSLKGLVGPEGIEPSTIRLKVECSTAELQARRIPEPNPGEAARTIGAAPGPDKRERRCWSRSRSWRVSWPCA